MKAEIETHKDVKDKLLISGLNPGEKVELTSNSELVVRKVKVNRCGYAIVNESKNYPHANIAFINVNGDNYPLPTLAPFTGTSPRCDKNESEIYDYNDIQGQSFQHKDRLYIYVGKGNSHAILTYKSIVRRTANDKGEVEMDAENFQEDDELTIAGSPVVVEANSDKAPLGFKQPEEESSSDSEEDPPSDSGGGDGNDAGKDGWMVMPSGSRIPNPRKPIKSLQDWNELLTRHQQKLEDSQKAHEDKLAGDAPLDGFPEGTSPDFIPDTIVSGG